MRRARLALVVIAVMPLCWPAPATAQATTVTLTVAPEPVAYGATATFSGSLAPPASEPVTVYRQAAAGPEAVASGTSGPDGRYALEAVVRAPGTFVAQTAAAASPGVIVHVRPLLDARFEGLRILGAPLHLAGRLRPAGAGALTISAGGSTRTLPIDPNGAFRARIPSRRRGRVCARVVIQPAAGFVEAWRRWCTRIETPTLSIGSRGAAVRYLGHPLARRRYALRGADRIYEDDTRDAVLAFQKVEGLARDGVAGPQVWHALLSARTPRPATGGTHIDVETTRQVLFEVRKGRVVKIIHVSTGATGNTPVGRRRIYLKTPGYNALGMYYSMYFLRGFAIHGYASVPPYPASHGCVRLPLWFAPRIYSRWPVGARVRVLP
jgi:L,D-transpeptidase catalytic domain/Putative peptidoglycan binding domain